MQRPLVRSEWPQAVQSQIDAFANADSGGAGQQKGIGRQVIGSAQFLLEELIILWRKRSGQITRARRKVVRQDEARLDGMAVGGQVVQQAAEAEQVVGTSF